ncbi:unnamed protein product [Brachionus calyciflorus]|nr:unnamed protein product [Brachionus calyciflorus]
MPKFENTYKLSPDEHKRFYAYKLQPQILKTLKNHVEKYETEGKSNSNLTRDLADAIRIDAKNMGFQRYKLVVFVTVGDNVGQDVRVASRCLWNPEFDNCISVTHKTKTLWATATVYIIYND